MDRNGKATKLPFSPASGRMASVADRNTWVSFDEAIWNYHHCTRNGIGFVFSSTASYGGIDLDHMCLDDGRVDDDARRIVREISSYTELSPSGHGFHIIAKANHGYPGTRQGQVQMYSACRYFSMTGRVIKAVPPIIEERTAQLEVLWKSLGGEEPHPLPEQLPDASEDTSASSDKEVFELACDLNTRFWPLYVMGNLFDYKNDHSCADCALVGMLARVTRDTTQIDRLFRASALYRPKWDERHYSDGRTYGEGVIRYVLGPSRDRRR